jgi:3-dehydroquinate synthase
MAAIEMITRRQHRCSIQIQQDILRNENLLKKVFQKKRKLLIVTDVNVAERYLEQVAEKLRPYATQVDSFVLPADEQAKTLFFAEKIIDFLDNHSYTRTDNMLALGGGVIGDSAGFCASVYRRGMGFIQMPTTLLAQVDSSIGGKTALNTAEGKNRLGTVSQPNWILIDPLFLKSLSREQYLYGFAEIIKYAVVMDAALFDYLEKTPLQAIEQNISRLVECCVRHKITVVAEDELDHGKRMILNFGHSVAHAVETLYGYDLFSHGQAVSLGMYAMATFGEQQGLTKPGSAEKIKKVLQKFELPFTMPVLNKQKLFHAMKNDKKSQGDTIKEVIVSEIGTAKITEMPFSIIEEIATR